jgi:hypothetical protein
VKVSSLNHTIQITPNAKLIYILQEVQDIIKGDFFIKKPVLHKNQGIIETSPTDLLKAKPHNFRQYRINKDLFVSESIVQSLTLTETEQKEPLLTGNFLAVFEDWCITACHVVADHKFVQDIESLLTRYERFCFENINADEALFNNTAKAFSDISTLSPKEAKDLLIRLGTYCYLHRDPPNLDKADEILTSAEEAVIRNYKSITKDDFDEILLLVSILKHHIFRLLKRDKEQYSDRVVKAVQTNLENLRKAQSEKGLQFTILLHSAYLKSLMDAEKYNFAKGKEIVEEQGTKAASVSFMSRNLSHNIGSHIIAYWNSKLEEYLKNAESKERDNDREFTYSDEQKLIKGSKELLQYVQHRMDFIAEISTAVPSSEMSIDMDKDIISPLIKPNDDKYGNDEKKISPLLEYIAHSEGIDLHKRIVLDIDEHIGANGRRVSLPNGLIGTHAIYSILENFVRNAAKHYNGKDSAMVFEYDNIDLEMIKRYLQAGRHAKGWTSAITNKLKDVKNRADCCSKLNELIKGPVCVFTQEEARKTKDGRIQGLYERFGNAGVDTKRAINRELLETTGFLSDTVIKIDVKEHSEDYLRVRIWDMREGSCNGKILRRIREYLPGGTLHAFSEGGKLKSGGWGIKEMIICANFLRKNTSEDLYSRLKNKGGKQRDSHYRAPALFNVVCDTNGRCFSIGKKACSRDNRLYKSKLGVEFYLRKPKDLCFDLPLEQEGIKAEIFGIDPLRKCNDREIPHRMLLVASEESRNEYFNNPIGPYRVLLDKSFTSINDQDYVNLYERYVKEFIWQRKEPLPKLVPFQGWMNFGNCDLTLAGSVNPTNEICFVYHLPTNKQFSELFDSCLYLQPVSAGYTTKAKLINPPTHPLSLRHFCLEHIEAALTKVVIVDERLSEWPGKDYAKGRKIRDILAKLGIFIVELSLTNLDLERLRKGLSSLKEKHVKNDASFLIIHQGVLDKLRKIGKRDADTEFMKDMNGLFRWKVIDSGRGLPENIDRYEKSRVRFVEISGLKRQLENYDKHGVVQLLFATRLPSTSWSPGE